MILVNLSRSWTEVLAGKRDAADVTLGDWAGITDDSVARYGDAILGIHHNAVVTAFDIEGWHRDGSTDRIRFDGRPSERWASLIGTPNPGAEWVRGAARPVKYLDTRVLTEGDVPVEEYADGGRAVVRGYTLTVDSHGNATVLPPAGGAVTVVVPSA